MSETIYEGDELGLADQYGGEPAEPAAAAFDPGDPEQLAQAVEAFQQLGYDVEPPADGGNEFGFDPTDASQLRALADAGVTADEMVAAGFDRSNPAHVAAAAAAMGGEAPVQHAPQPDPGERLNREVEKIVQADVTARLGVEVDTARVQELADEKYVEQANELFKITERSTPAQNLAAARWAITQAASELSPARDEQDAARRLLDSRRILAQGKAPSGPARDARGKFTTTARKVWA